MDPRIDEVIAFWFGPDPVPGREIEQRWFRRDPAFDDAIRGRFGALLDDVRALDAWRGTPRGDLATVLVLDQFSRNLFRDSPRAFEHDARALAIARELVASSGARTLAFHHRVFVLMPFQHAEDVATQHEGIAHYAALVDEARAAQAPGLAFLESALDSQRRHAAIVERFGRFPHRNEVLGRASTPEETAFLAQPGSRF